jgi:ectoine hydroxylase
MALEPRPRLRDQTAMRLTAAQLEQFQRDGVFVLPNLFSTADVAVLRGELQAVLVEDTPANFREKDGRKVRTTMGLHLRNPVFAKLGRRYH